MRKILLISLLCIPFITLNAQSKKEQITTLTLRIDSLSNAIMIKDSVEKVNNIKIATLTKNLSKSNQDLKEIEALNNTLKHSCAVLADTLKKKQVELNLLNTEKEFVVNPIYDNIPIGFTMQDTSSSAKGDFDSDGIPDFATVFSNESNPDSPLAVVYLSSNYKENKSFSSLNLPCMGMELKFKNNELSIDVLNNQQFEKLTFKYYADKKDLKLIRYFTSMSMDGSSESTNNDFVANTYVKITGAKVVKNGKIKQAELITISNCSKYVEFLQEESYIIK